MAQGIEPVHHKNHVKQKLKYVIPVSDMFLLMFQNKLRPFLPKSGRNVYLRLNDTKHEGLSYAGTEVNIIPKVDSSFDVDSQPDRLDAGIQQKNHRTHQPQVCQKLLQNRSDHLCQWYPGLGVCPVLRQIRLLYHIVNGFRRICLQGT